MYSQPNAQDVSKRLLGRAGRVWGPAAAPSRAPLVFALTHATLSPAAPVSVTFGRRRGFPPGLTFFLCFRFFALVFAFFLVLRREVFPHFRLCCNSLATVGPVTATAIWVLSLGLEGQRKGVRGSREAAQRRESRKQKVSVQLVCVAMLRESKHQRKHKGLLSHSQMEK